MAAPARHVGGPRTRLRRAPKRGPATRPPATRSPLRRGGRMAAGKTKAAKAKIHAPPDDTGGLEGHYHVYIFDVFNQEVLAGKPSHTIQRAVPFPRAAQERLCLDQ